MKLDWGIVEEFDFADLKIQRVLARLAALEAVTGIGPFMWGYEDLGKFFVGEPREFNGLPMWVPLAVADRAVRERERMIFDLRSRIDELIEAFPKAWSLGDFLDEMGARREEIVRLRGEVARSEKLRKMSDELVDFWTRANDRLEEKIESERCRVFELEQALLHVLQAVMGCQLYGVVSRKVEPRTDVEIAIVEIDQIVRGALGDRDVDGETQDLETQDFASVRGQWRSSVVED